MGEIFIYKQDRKIGLVGFQLKKAQVITDEVARRVGDSLKVDWNKINFGQFKQGLNVEQEHANSLHLGLEGAGKIAIDHIREIPDYYTRLNNMENKAKMEEKGGMQVEKGGPGSGRYPAGSGKPHDEEDIYNKASSSFETELENNPKAGAGELNEIMEREHPDIPTELRDKVIDRITESQFKNFKEKTQEPKAPEAPKKKRSLAEAPPRDIFDEKGRMRYRYRKPTD